MGRSPSRFWSIPRSRRLRDNYFRFGLFGTKSSAEDRWSTIPVAFSLAAQPVAALLLRSGRERGKSSSHVRREYQ